MKQKKSSISKVGITIRTDLLERVDEFADNNYLTRSGLISIALNQYLNAQEAITLMRKLTSLMQEIADNRCVDDDAMKKLEEMEKVVNFLSNND